MSTGDRNFGMGEDYLTGLPNIQAFYKRLEQERKRARDPLTEGELAVLYFNLVNFRLINLRYGLAAGDGYLARMAESLAASFPDGMVSHGNGDHFLILTDTLHLEERVANAREAIRKVFPISVECSIGAGIWDDPTLKPEEVCYRARLASEQNRKHLHTYFSCYSKELGERLEIADYAVSHIEEAITLGWIHVYYQPIVRADEPDLRDGSARTLGGSEVWHAGAGQVHQPPGGGKADLEAGSFGHPPGGQRDRESLPARHAGDSRLHQPLPARLSLL